MEFIEQLNDYDFQFKFIITGLSDTGKTCLIDRIDCYNDYSKFIDCHKNIMHTIGVDFKIFFIKYKNKFIKIIFWDTSGDTSDETLVSSYFRGSHAFILCYDANDRDSFNYIKNKLSEIKNIGHNPICALIINKYDIKVNKYNKNIVSDEEALEFADKNDIIFRHISSIEKNENGIINLFESILDKVLNKERSRR